MIFHLICYIKFPPVNSVKPVRNPQTKEKNLSRNTNCNLALPFSHPDVSISRLELNLWQVLFGLECGASFKTNENHKTNTTPY